MIRRTRTVIGGLVLALLLGGQVAASAAPASPAADPGADTMSQARSRLAAEATAGVQITRDAWGAASFVATSAGAEVTNPAVSAATPVAAAARAHLDRYGAALGASRPGTTLVQRVATHTDAGTDVVRYTQHVGGVPVIGADVVVSLGADRQLTSLLSTMSSRTRVGEATIGAVAAKQVATRVVRRVAGAPTEVRAEGRWLLDPDVLGARFAPGARTVWRFDVRRGEDVRRTVLVDDRTGAVLMNLSTINEADRVVCDRANVATSAQPPCNTGFARTEGGPASGVADVNTAYDLSGEVSTFYRQIGGIDLTEALGIDVGGVKKLASTVRFCVTGQTCPYANAFWNGKQMYYGEGYAGADDVVGHEMTHGIVDQYSELFYWGQSGAINESVADIMGEIVDHRNVGPGDSPGNWALGEDLPCCSPNGIRNLKNPTLFGDPDRTGSPNWNPDSPNFDDSGGVHTNSGVGNKTAYLISQGGTFNGRSITGIDGANAGLTKTAKLYLLTIQSLSSGSDYADLGRVLDQSCQTLVGSSGFTTANCTNVHKATLATQLATTPTKAPQPADARATCPTGQVKRVLFNSESGTPAAKFTAGIRWSRAADPGWGSNAHSGVDAWSNAGSSTVSSSSLVVAAPIAVPAGRKTYLHFHQWRFLDFGPDFYDGGTVEVDDLGDAAGPLDVAARPWVNGPGQTLSTSLGNPAGGRKAFAGDSSGYVASRLDLSSFGGRNIRPQFTLSNDSSVNFLPWYLDDITVYTCDLRVGVGKVTVKGKAVVGKKLKAKPQGWSPGGVGYTYQWLRNGKAVKNAHAKAYKLGGKDKGKKMSVRVTGRKAGYLAGTRTSKRTGEVKARRR